MGNFNGTLGDVKNAYNKRQRREDRLATREARLEANSRKPLEDSIEEAYRECRKEHNAHLDRQYDLYRRFCERALRLIEEARAQEPKLAKLLWLIVDRHRLSTRAEGSDSPKRELSVEDNSGFCRLDHLYESLQAEMQKMSA